VVTSTDKRREERRRSKEAGLGNAPTPQARAVELITSFIAREVNADSAVIGFVRLQAAELTQELSDAGLLSSGTQEDQGEEGDGSQEEEGSRCGACGDRYRVDLNIPDELWREVGMPEHSGLLCGRCIMTRLEELAVSDNGFGYLLAHEGCVAGDGSLSSNAFGEVLRLSLLALLNAEQMCQYHGTDFERMGMQRGEPRCDSCKQPFRVKQALAAIEACHTQISRR
jgi:hypothetical protein